MCNENNKIEEVVEMAAQQLSELLFLAIDESQIINPITAPAKEQQNDQLHGN